MSSSKKEKCPKCGFMNIEGTKKCTKCHCNLDKKRKSCPKCAKYNDIEAKSISLALKICAAFIILFIVVGTFTYGRGEVVDFSAEEKIVNTKSFNKVKLICSIIICIGILVAGGVLVYYYVIK